MLNSSCFSEGRPKRMCARAKEGQVRECGNVDEDQYEHEEKWQRAPTLEGVLGYTQVDRIVRVTPTGEK
jgi:hypothetical protein